MKCVPMDANRDVGRVDAISQVSDLGPRRHSKFECTGSGETSPPYALYVALVCLALSVRVFVVGSAVLVEAITRIGGRA